MSGALDPIQQDLPLDAPSSPASPPASPPPPTLYEQLWRWLRSLPWKRWRQQATPMVQAGAAQVSGALRLAVTRGTPYTIKLARATAKLRLVETANLAAARAIHVAGLPAVVVRTTIQLLIAHRAGLTIEQTTFFRVDDPAGYVVYEAPPRLSTALAVAWIPGVVMAVLSLICLIPALVPHRVLMLPTTPMTWLQIWLGLAFAAHVFPAYEEAGPLAEQARVGVKNADPIAVLCVVPTWATAMLTKTGGTLPAAAGVLALWWFAGAIFGT